MLKVYKPEVKNKLIRKARLLDLIVGMSYVIKYDETSQGVFFNYLQEYGIMDQYNMLATLENNGVAERRNRTLMNMVRSMTSKINLSDLTLGEALKNLVNLSLNPLTMNKKRA